MERQYVRQDDKARSLVEWPFVQENSQDVKGEPSEKIQGKTHWQKEKTMWEFQVGKDLMCSRRLECLEGSDCQGS